MHTILSRSRNVRHLSALHFIHFLADFNFLHTVYILKLFSTVFQPLSMLVIFFPYTPDITPKYHFNVSFHSSIVINPVYLFPIYLLDLFLFSSLYIQHSVPSIIFSFPFQSVDIPFQVVRLLISLSILLFHHGSFFSPILPFFTPTTFAT